MSNNILKGKRGIIFGALDEKSIAWKVAEHAHAEELTMGLFILQFHNPLLLMRLEFIK